MSLFNTLVKLFTCMVASVIVGDAFAQTVTVAGSGTASSYLYNPLYTFNSGTAARYYRSASIYPQSLITGIPVGATINSISLHRANDGGVLPTGSTLKIYLLNTTTNDWGSSSLAWDPSTATLVFDGDPSTIVGSTNGYKQFTFNTPNVFTYTGNNIAVLSEYTQPSGPATVINWTYQTTTSQPAYVNNQQKYISSTSALQSSLSSSTGNHANIIFSYTPASGCSGAPTPGTATSSAAAVCSGASVNLNLTGITPSSGIEYTWQYSTAFAGPYVDVSTTSTSSSYTATPPATGFYRAKVYCNNPGGDSSFSVPVGVGVDQPLPANTYTINNTQPTAGTNFNSFTDAAMATRCGILGNVIFEVAAGQVFNEPTGVNFTVTGSPTATLTFIKSGSGANPKIQTSGTSGTDDYVLRLTGGDYFTFDGIDLAQTGTATADWTDIGIYLQNASATNGARNNTFKNMTITLSNSNTVATGVYVLQSPTPTSTAGANSNNKFINLKIDNAFTGYFFDGASSTYPDDANEITTEGSGTSEVKNLGDGTAAASMYGVRAAYQTNFKVSNTSISNLVNAGTSLVYGLNAQSSTANSFEFSNNTVTGISGGGTSYGIYVSAAASGTITNNSISNISTSGSSSSVRGIYITATGISTTITSNRVYDVSSTGTSSTTAAGIDVGTGLSHTLVNNMVSSISAPRSSSTTAGTRGISVSGGTAGGQLKIYYNTVLLTAVPDSASFTSAALHLATTVPNIDIRNNIFINKSDVSAIGTRAVAFWRTSVTPINMDPASDNNLYYAGTPSSKNLIYYNGTTGAQTLYEYKTFSGIPPRDGAAVTEDVAFQPIVNGTLRPSTASPTQAESQGQPIAGYTTDFENQSRDNTPDLGADEFTGVLLDTTGPSFSYTLLGNTSSTADRTITVTITDPSGVATGSPGSPRIYFRKGTSGAFTSAASTSSSGNSYTFTISETALGGVAGGDTVQYYFAAQDGLGNSATSPFGGSGVNPPGSTAPATFNQYRIMPSYVWQGSSSDYQDANNWSPARTTPDVQDVLVFDGAITPTTTVSNIPTQTVARIRFISGITATLNGAASSTLTLNATPSETPEALFIQAGSTVNVGTTSALIINHAGTGQTSTINGTFVINGTSTFSAANSVTTVNGTVEINGTATTPVTGTIATLKFAPGSNLIYRKNGGTVPTAEYDASSTVSLIGAFTSSISWPSSTPAGNLTYNSTGTASQSLASTLTTIQGNLTVENTGTGTFTTGTTTTTNINIAGTTTLNNGTWLVAGNIVNFNGGFYQNGGVVNKTNTSAQTWNTTTLVQNAGSITSAVAGLFTFTATGNVVLNGTVDGGASGGINFGFSGTADQTFSTATINNRVGIAINKSAGKVTFNNSFVLNSGASFNITDGALEMAPATTLTIAGTADFNNQPVVLRSSSTGTASIGTITGTLANASDVTVERYIPAAGNRAWRLLAAPLAAATAPTIYNSWQEGGAATAGYGTHITNTGGAATNGFDGSSIALAPSIRYYDGSALQSPSNTNATKVTDNGAAWFLFVRGDRTINQNLVSASGNTTLRMKGTINQGTVTAGVAGTAFSLIPNPYPSNVDYEAVYSGNGSTYGTYYIWDANLGSVGGYRTVERLGAGSYQQTPAGGSTAADNTARYIQSGQAFFIPNNAQLTFTETMKTEQMPTINVFRPTTVGEQILVNLSAKEGSNFILTDAVRAKYGDTYTAAVTPEDAPKMNNFTENLAIARNSQLLSIEKRPFITTNDTLFLKLSGTNVQDYRFTVEPLNLSASGLEAYLEDAFLGTSTQLSLANATDVDFSITSNTASAADNRFRIVFKQAGTLPVSGINIKAAKQGEQVRVDFEAINEHNMVQYDVQRSANGNEFNTIATKAAIANNGTNMSYTAIDNQPINGDNYYRIKAIDKSGRVQYSSIARVKMGNGKEGIVVYPNPVRGEVIGLQMQNLPEGKYNVQLFNNMGQEVFRSIIQHNGGNSSQSLNAAALSAKGTYTLRVSNGTTTITQTIITQ